MSIHLLLRTDAYSGQYIALGRMLKLSRACRWNAGTCHEGVAVVRHY